MNQPNDERRGTLSPHRRNGRTGSATTLPTAGPSSEVLREAGDPFLPLPEGTDSIKLSRGDYNVMRQAANRGFAAACRGRREQALGRAVSSGRIAASSVGQWRAKYNQGPRATVRQIEALSPGVVPVQAATGGGSAAVARVETDESGQMTFRGFPVAMGAGGKPSVLVEAGWMDVEAFEASGLSDDDLRWALHSATSFPQTRLGQLFRAGPGGS